MTKYKAALLIYEWVSSRTGSKCYCLSDRTVAMLLTLTGTLYWKTRWEGYKDFTDAQLQEIFDWSSEVERELMNGCCGGGGQSLRFRVNVEGRIEVSDDGGVTYEVDDDFDPRSTGTVYAPIAMGTVDEDACQAAANVVANLTELINEDFVGVLTSVSAAAAISAGAAPFIAAWLGVPVAGEGVAVAAFIAAMVGAGAAEGAAAIEDAFDTEFYDWLNCKYYCMFGNEELTWADVDALIDALNEEYPDGGEDFTLRIVGFGVFKALGPVGLTNMARLGAAAADCEACECPAPEWCINFDFAIDQYGFTAFNGTWDGSGFSNTTSVVVSGNTVYRAVAQLLFDLPAGSRVTGITMYFEGEGRGDGQVNEIAGEGTDGQLPTLEEVVNTTIKSGFLTTPTTTLDYDGGFRIYAGVDGTTPDSVRVTRVWVAGTGTLPEGWEEYPICE